MKRIVEWLKYNEHGQGTLEYGLILMIISIAFILVLTALGIGLGDKYIWMNTKMLN